MEDWWKTTLLLCIYGFFKEIRPSEPYLTEYLVGNSTGLTDEQVIYFSAVSYLLMVRRW
jgi:thiamine transporter 2/3